MSYDPYPHQQGHYPQYPEGGHYQRQRRDSSETIIRVIRFVVGAVITIFALHILFVIFDANQGNGFVSTIYVLAKIFVLGLGDVFTPDDEMLGVIVNYALAALVWAVAGKLVIKALRRP